MKGRPVFVEEYYPGVVLKMVWQSHVRIEDVTASFEEIYDYLEHAENQICVFVDITANPYLLMHQTFFRAMNVQRHPNMKT